MRTKRWWIGFFALALIGCGAPIIEEQEDPRDEAFMSGGKTDTGGIEEDTPEALAIIKLCNESTIAQLKEQVGLPKKARENIYNSDAKPFSTLKQIDDIPYVGVSAFGKLLQYVVDNDLVQSSGGSSGGGSGGSSGYVSFPDRLKALAQKYPDRVVIAKRRSKPAVFLKTHDLTTKSELKEFYGDLYEALGANTLMVWNPAHENYFHAASGVSANSALDDKFKGRPITLYNTFHLWDASLGNMDNDCDDPDAYDDDSHTEIVDVACKKPDDIEAERTVALIKLHNNQLAAWNTYLTAIVDDFYGTLGETEYNGGIPPYIYGDDDGQHNCTSWATSWLYANVSEDYDIYGNPAAFLQLIWGSWGDPEPDQLRGFLIFNNPETPDAGDSVPSDHPVQFGH